MMIENVNMQMEAENADVYDRKLISLYGMKSSEPTRMDLIGNQSLKVIENS